ncbi:MAG: peptidylprolyl isomerase [Ignavibacteriales bacterium]|nr:MAG: peptidylprolyl isomerase [Ignavibacteriales bacterium]
MFLRKIILVVLLIFIFSSCKRNYKTIILNNEYKKGVTLDTLMNLKDNEQLVATIETNLGKIEIELYAKEVPKTVKNFVGLALEGYYNGVIFHRVIKDFMVQTGDSTGTGMGGKSIYGKDFEDEFVNSLHHNTPGILSMANAGPNTNRSQFFITVAPTLWLDRKHTIFGKVADGMDVVYQISNVQTSRGDKPAKDIVMKNVTVEKHIF